MKTHRARSIGMVGGLVASALVVSAALAGAQTVNPAFSTLTDMTWVRMYPNYEPVALSYSGITYGEGKLYYFGGGHATYQGNDVQIYDIGSNTWSQSYPPEFRDCVGDGGGGATTLSPLGRPQSEHTYQYLSWDPITHRYVGVLTPGLWAFNPADNGWTALSGPYAPNGGITPGVPGSTGCRSLTAWDNDVGGFIAVVNGGGNDVYVWRNVTQGWVRIGGHPINNYAQIYSAYAPDRRIHLFTDETSYWIYTPASNTWRTVATPPSGLVKNFSFDYDTVNRIFVGASMASNGAVVIYTYDVDADRWTPVASQGTVPQRSMIIASWSKQIFRYDPINNVFIFLNKEADGYSCFTNPISPGQRATWAYRYRRASGGPIDTTPPTPPPNFRAG